MRLWNLGASLLALLVVACGGQSSTLEQQAEGTLQLPLVSPAPDGKTYRLVGAKFDIAGPQTVSLTDTSADTVVTTLQAGSYTIKLAEGWHLERTDAPGTTVPSQLLSPNPLPFFVNRGEVTQVRFQFKLAGAGTADVGIRVDSGGWLAGTLQFTERVGATPGAFDELVGKSVPFLITYESSTLTRFGSYSDKIVHVQSGPVTVQFGGAPSELLARAAASLKGAELSYDLRAMSPSGTISFDHMMLIPNTPDGFRFELRSYMPFQGSVDAEGYPAARSFQLETEAFLTDGNSPEGVRGSAKVNGLP